MFFHFFLFFSWISFVTSNVNPSSLSLFPSQYWPQKESSNCIWLWYKKGSLCPQLFFVPKHSHTRIHKKPRVLQSDEFIGCRKWRRKLQTVNHRYQMLLVRLSNRSKNWDKSKDDLLPRFSFELCQWLYDSTADIIFVIVSFSLIEW